MKVDIIEEKQNPLFNRKEIILEVESDVTPSLSESEKIISEKFKAEPEAFKIKKIEGKFGSRTFKISANVYPSKGEKEEIEVKTKQEKEAEAKALEEAKKAAEEAKKAEEEAKKVEAESKEEAPAEEKAEENPAEEPAKEEAKPEEKS